jgi:hypothetical protein
VLDLVEQVPAYVADVLDRLVRQRLRGDGDERFVRLGLPASVCSVSITSISRHGTTHSANAGASIGTSVQRVAVFAELEGTNPKSKNVAPTGNIPVTANAFNRGRR